MVTPQSCNQSLIIISNKNMIINDKGKCLIVDIGMKVARGYVVIAAFSPSKTKQNSILKT